MSPIPTVQVFPSFSGTGPIPACSFISPFPDYILLPLVVCNLYDTVTNDWAISLWLRAIDALAEDLSLVPQTHKERKLTLTPFPGPYAFP